MFASGGPAAALLPPGEVLTSLVGPMASSGVAVLHSGTLPLRGHAAALRRPHGRDAAGGHDPRQRVRARAGAAVGRGHHHHRERHRGGRHDQRCVDARRGGVDRRPAQHHDAERRGVRHPAAALGRGRADLHAGVDRRGRPGGDAQRAGGAGHDRAVGVRARGVRQPVAGAHADRPDQPRVAHHRDDDGGARLQPHARAHRNQPRAGRPGRRASTS